MSRRVVEAEIIERVDLRHSAGEQVRLGSALIRALPSKRAAKQKPPDGSMLTVGESGRSSSRSRPRP